MSALLHCLCSHCSHVFWQQLQAPVPVPKDVQDLVCRASGGFVSIVVLPRHVRDATLDEFTWTLLTLQDHVHYHVKCFKVN